MRKLIARLVEWLIRQSPSYREFQTTRKRQESLILEQKDTIAAQARLLNDASVRADLMYQDNVERIAELVEARQMAGAGPWLTEGRRPAPEGSTRLVREGLALKENPITSQGAFGDIELALQNVEWRREINLSWLEFSRWGIQQIMLISRLYYIKNPLIRRAIDISAAYVFGRGYEVSSDDDDANEVLQEFFEANRATLGQIALVELEKRKYYDGNLFFAFFADTADKGTVQVRDIDATEIQDILCNPEDADDPWFYKREWTQRIPNLSNGTVQSQSQARWYPAIGYVDKAKDKPDKMGGVEIAWDVPVLHRKCGKVSKWRFGCPLIYPAIDWAKAAKRFLEHCNTVKAALAQIALKVTTKGGQQAIEGTKQQLQTSVGPTSSLWDQNPSAVAGSVFVSGPGTNLEMFNTRGGGGDMNEVRPLVRMVAMCVGIPETFFSDTDVGQLATATSLDRPTELNFQEKQEAWREDLVIIANWVLKTSKDAAGGKYRAALDGRKMSAADREHFEIREAKRIKAGVTALGNIQMGYEPMEPLEAGKRREPTKAAQVRATFPAIREGDAKELINGVVQAMTLNNRGGQIIGIDEKEGIRKLYELTGFENADELAEMQYPDTEYDPDRTHQVLTDPIKRAKALPGGTPATAVQQGDDASGARGQQPGPATRRKPGADDTAPTEADRRRARAAIAAVEAESDE